MSAQSPTTSLNNGTAMIQSPFARCRRYLHRGAVYWASWLRFAALRIWELENATDKARIVVIVALGLCVLLISYGRSPKGPPSSQQ